MPKLDLQLVNAEMWDAGPGQYSDKKALDILQRHLQDQIPKDDAVKEMTAMLPDEDASPTRRGEISVFGSFLCEMGEQIPFQDPRQTKLAHLILGLSQSTKLGGHSEHNGYPFWYSMDNFRMQLREHFGCDFDDDPEYGDAYAKALNLSCFLARLTQCGFCFEPGFAIWTMQYGLERKVEDRLAMDGLISCAALWIAIAGQALFVQVVVNPDSETNRLLGPGLHNKESALGLQRWKLWQKALANAAEYEKTGKETRVLAGRASTLMDAIEQNLSFAGL